MDSSCAWARWASSGPRAPACCPPGRGGAAGRHAAGRRRRLPLVRRGRRGDERRVVRAGAAGAGVQRRRAAAARRGPRGEARPRQPVERGARRRRDRAGRLREQFPDGAFDTTDRAVALGAGIEELLVRTYLNGAAFAPTAARASCSAGCSRTTPRCSRGCAASAASFRPPAWRSRSRSSRAASCSTASSPPRASPRERTNARAVPTPDARASRARRAAARDRRRALRPRRGAGARRVRRRVAARRVPARSRRRPTTSPAPTSFSCRSSAARPPTCSPRRARRRPRRCSAQGRCTRPVTFATNVVVLLVPSIRAGERRLGLRPQAGRLAAGGRQRRGADRRLHPAPARAAAAHLGSDARTGSAPSPTWRASSPRSRWAPPTRASPT